MLSCLRGENMKEKIKSLTYIILGNTIIALAVSKLILKNNIIVGGVTGFGRVVNYFTGVSVTTAVYIISITLFLAAVFFIGKEFAFTTLISTFLFPTLLDIFENQDILQNFCKNIFLACVLAGCFMGVGIGLILKANASTGGTDIIAIILNKKFNIPVYITLNLIDLSMLTLQIVFSNITSILYGLIIVFLTSFTLNKTLSFGKGYTVNSSYNDPDLSTMASI